MGGYAISKMRKLRIIKAWRPAQDYTSCRIMVQNFDFEAQSSFSALRISQVS